MSTEGQSAGAPEVREIDENVLKDLESRFSSVQCPVHGTAPTFDIAPDGSVVEHMCCETLRSIIRELQVKAGEREPGSGEPRLGETEEAAG